MNNLVRYSHIYIIQKIKTLNQIVINDKITRYIKQNMTNDVKDPTIEDESKVPTTTEAKDKEQPKFAAATSAKGKAEDVLTWSVRESLVKDMGDSIEMKEIEDVPEGMENHEVFSFEIKDKEKFLSPENARKLIPYFGKLVFDCFQDRTQEVQMKLDTDEEMEEFIQDYFMEGDLASTDTVYAIAEGGKVIGFYFLVHTKVGEMNIGRMLLATIAPEYRNKGLYRKILGIVLSNEKQIDQFTGLTHTPEIVVKMIEAGKSTGFDIYIYIIVIEKTETQQSHYPKKKNQNSIKEDKILTQIS